MLCPIFMSMKNRYALFALAVLLSSCEFKCSIGKDGNTISGKDTTNSKSRDKSTSEKTAPKVLNDISIDGKNITINQAYLARESGELVPAGNTVPLGEKVILTINSEGWKSIGGKSFLGINQVITTSTGEIVLDSGDMFAKYDETGIDAEYTNLLKLKAYITETMPGIEYFNVTFRVWDKKGDGEVKGSYRFYIK